MIRSASSITWAVWRALFLREAVTRLAAGRAAWLWILLEPIAHLIALNIIFGFILQRVMSGIPGGLFITTGLLGYFMAINTATRSKDAIGANVGLLTYRQVVPVDTVLVRAVLEAVLLLVSSLFLFAVLFIIGFQIIPNDVLLVFAAFVALWLLGLGLGLVFSVINELIPDTKKLTKFIFQPLYFLSGIMYPIAILPPAYQELALLNPLVHGIEIVRAGFFPQYHAVNGVNLGYILIFAITTIFLGFALHVRFSPRLVAQ